MTQDEIQAVARAICDDAGCIWDDDPNTPARLEWSRAAKAAIAALDAARGDRVAQLEQAIAKARQQLWEQREKADDTLRIALEQGDPFNG